MPRNCSWPCRRTNAPRLLKIFAAEAKDSALPSFVPADTMKFWRWRLNMNRSYKALEAMLNDLIPAQAMAQINMVFAMAGKDKDEHYDLKSELLNNLGDDIISYSKPPKSTSIEDIKSPPTLYLIGSPNPDKLAAALKVLLAIPFQGSPHHRPRVSGTENLPCRPSYGGRREIRRREFCRQRRLPGHRRRHERVGGIPAQRRHQSQGADGHAGLGRCRAKGGRDEQRSVWF